MQPIEVKLVAGTIAILSQRDWDDETAEVTSLLLHTSNIPSLIAQLQQAALTGLTE